MHQVYVWVGSQANALEKKLAAETAAKFVAATGRADDIPVVMVQAGAEPSMSTAAFLG